MEVFDTTLPFQLLPIFRERIWGRAELSPFFPRAPVTNRIGEAWFTASENRILKGNSLGEVLSCHPEILGSAADPDHPGICPLLVKLLFTSERLSVQVHPDDEYARDRHSSLGKTEAWYILDAQPPHEVAVGFREPISAEQLRSAADSGEIERLLDWRPVDSGDVMFVPAGTVHAIGAGLTICEIQQNSDITYRLYDYGRGRELHLDDGACVSKLGPHAWRPQPVKLASGRDEVLASDYFRIERLRPRNNVHIAARMRYYILLICLKGMGTIAGQLFAPGQCWMLPAANAETIIDGSASEWLLAYTAPEPACGLLVE